MSVTYKNMKRFFTSLKKSISKYPKIALGAFLGLMIFIGALWFISNRIGIQNNGTFKARADRIAQSGLPLKAEIVFGKGNGDVGFKDFFLSKINSAKESLSIAMYSIEDPEIISALQEKKNQGVRVEIVVPLRKERQHSITFALTDLELMQIGKATALSDQEYQESPSGFMHHKFILIDEETPDRQLVLSSSNLTKSQFLYDPGFALSSYDVDVINEFSNEFSRIKNSDTSLKKLRSGEYQPFTLQKEYKDGLLNLWFSPGYLENSVKTSMLDYIDQAQSSIRVVGWVITDKEIWNAIIKKSREGIKVTVIVDDHFLWNGSSSVDIAMMYVLPNLTIASDSYVNLILEQEGILGVKVSDSFNSFLHHHTLLVDDTYLFMGTNNWSRGGFYLNDEATVFTSVSSLVNSYATELDRLEKQLVGKPFVAKYNPDQNILETQNLSEQATTLIAYREESDPLWLGQKCGEFTIGAEKISLEPDCITSRTRIFALDKEGVLVASTYLQIK
jgi:phosphatidylserine/phosphatidylglycerophosphate/cardiolipin synthase-like enzyme